jgi:hypothetical protein
VKAEKYLVDSLQVRDFYPTRIALVLAQLSQEKLAAAENIRFSGIERKAGRQRFEDVLGIFSCSVGRVREAER